MPDSSQVFLRELDKKLWTAADWQRSNLPFGQDQWAWGAHLRRAQRARRVAAMNMGICGNYFGKEPADTFTRGQHPDLRALIV